MGQTGEDTKGEVIKGVLQEDWSLLKGYTAPRLDKNAMEGEKDYFKTAQGKFHLGALPGFPFAIMRYMRGMENLLMDIILNEDEVLELNGMVKQLIADMIDGYGKIGVDGVMIGEDWGTQSALLISPALWRKLFKPTFRELIHKVHENGMYMFMHSCGYIYEIIEDLIEVGVDVFQFDQPGLVGVERLSTEFGGRAAFWCPVDTQSVMPAGDRDIIEAEARKMIRSFGRFDGGFIAKDYHWFQINVDHRWAQWARDIFVKEGIYTA
jgi:uroporphyrinogen decarboxylase